MWKMMRFLSILRYAWPGLAWLSQSTSWFSRALNFLSWFALKWMLRKQSIKYMLMHQFSQTYFMFLMFQKGYHMPLTTRARRISNSPHNYHKTHFVGGNFIFSKQWMNGMYVLIKAHLILKAFEFKGQVEDGRLNNSWVYAAESERFSCCSVVELQDKGRNVQTEIVFLRWSCDARMNPYMLSRWHIIHCT